LIQHQISARAWSLEPNGLVAPGSTFQPSTPFSLAILGPGSDRITLPPTGAPGGLAAGEEVTAVAIGYADGVHRQRSNRGHALVRGQAAPLVGTVSMDAITLDVTDIEGASEGDIVTLIGVDGDEKITAEQAARWSGTISYEVLTSLGPRVERRYIE
jgi:hypothetical protein